MSGLGLVPAFKSQRKAIGGIIRNINNIWDHLNVEVKHADLKINDSLSSTATFIDLCDFNVGITAGNGNSLDIGYREGNKIRVRSVNAKLKLRNSGTLSTTATVLLVKHYENFDGVGPVFDDIYDPHTGQFPDCRLRNDLHYKNYKILARRQVVVAGDEDADRDQNLNMYVRHRKRVGSFVEWEGGSGLDPSNGKYYLVYFDDGLGTCQIDGATRITYIDN